MCSGEYGDYADRMVAEVDNGRSTNYCKKYLKYEDAPQEGSSQASAITYAPTTIELKSDPHSYESSSWMQFKILLFRMWLQMWRDKVRKAFSIYIVCLRIRVFVLKKPIRHLKRKDTVLVFGIV